MKKSLQKTIQRQRQQRIGRVRSKIVGSATIPRLAINRSLTKLSAQIINDDSSSTICSVHQNELKEKKIKGTEMAISLGQLIADKAKKAGVHQVVFDRRYFKYHGLIKAFADSARKEGLKF